MPGGQRPERPHPVVGRTAGGVHPRHPHRHPAERRPGEGLAVADLRVLGLVGGSLAGCGLPGRVERLGRRDPGDQRRRVAEHLPASSCPSPSACPALLGLLGHAMTPPAIGHARGLPQARGERGRSTGRDEPVRRRVGRRRRPHLDRRLGSRREHQEGPGVGIRPRWPVGSRRRPAPRPCPTVSPRQVARPTWKPSASTRTCSRPKLISHQATHEAAATRSPTMVTAAR